MDIKPIETSYAGHRFRSRLEARWAVFFDAYGVEWIYEPQGYETEAGRYLPDFWIPAVSCWAEVKGSLTATAYNRLCDVIWHLPAMPEDLPARLFRHTPWLLLLGNIPSAEDADRAVHSLLRWGIAPDRTPATWTQDFNFAHPKHVLAMNAPLLASKEPDPNSLLESGSSVFLAPNPDLAEAYGRARRARFEFGESG